MKDILLLYGRGHREHEKSLQSLAIIIQIMKGMNNVKKIESKIMILWEKKTMKIILKNQTEHANYFADERDHGNSKRYPKACTIVGKEILDLK